MQSEASSRNYGVDVARVVSMVMVVMLHMLGKGGVLENLEPFSSNYFSAWLLEVLAYGAVNMFVMITGYLMIDNKFNYYKIIPLWLQVLFYSAGGTIISYLISPTTISSSEFITSFFPILGDRYWYFTNYFGMFFFIPFINKLFNSLSKNDLLKLIATALILFSLVTTLIHNDIFAIEYGYSPIWFILMYLIGAYIKIHGVPGKIQRKSLLIYYASALLAYFSKIIIDYSTLKIFGRSFGGNYLISYISPFIVISITGLFIFFEKLTISNTVIQKTLSFFAPITFGVYLIHMQPMIWEVIFADKFLWLADSSWLIIFLGVPILASMTYLVTTLIDYLRLKLFGFLRVNSLALLVEEKITHIWRSVKIYLLN